MGKMRSVCVWVWEQVVGCGLWGRRQGAMSGEGGDHDHGIYVTLLQLCAPARPASGQRRVWTLPLSRV